MRRHINAQRGREKLSHAVKALNTINLFAVKLNETDDAPEEKSGEGEGVNFNNVLRATLMHADPKSANKQ